MVDHLLALFRPFVDAVAIVAHPSFAGRVRSHLASILASGPAHEVFEQPSPTGMLDAVLAPAAWVHALAPEQVWIVWCDQVALRETTLERLASAADAHPSPDLVFPTVEGPHPYIHFARNQAGRITSVLQRRELDDMPGEGESDIGLFALSLDGYREIARYANTVQPGRGTGERNFLPAIPWLAERGTVSTIPCTDPREAIGINTPEELAMVERWLEERDVTS
jgi:bifunctional N-acetylglucosamine-1-phosphate-uridyltransferase/glucosamine-1-phosphate-acetyltransferase GlmU-like protein